MTPMDLDAFIQEALQEDIGSGDITTEAVVEPACRGRAVIITRQAGVICGTEVARKIFLSVDAALVVEVLCADGRNVSPNDVLLTITGSAASILKAERTALNVLQRLCGIASLTARCVSKLKYAALYDTRKTTPLWRSLEKYAVTVGGGHNHRMGLYDAVLIKDNHIAIAGSLTEAVHRIRRVHPDRHIEVEVRSLDELHEAIKLHAEIIMLDNFTADQVRMAVQIIDGMIPRPILEVSGGITAETITSLDLPGVDRISVGALTHSAPVLDLSLQMTTIPAGRSTSFPK